MVFHKLAMEASFFDFLRFLRFFLIRAAREYG
jgi:hypothetical protein